MTEPESICARCGCGVESGWQYPSCADFDTAEERWVAHRTYCTLIGRDLCATCNAEVVAEVLAA